MRTSHSVAKPFRLTAIAVSLLFAAGAVRADEAASNADAIRQDLAQPDSRIEAGVGYVSGDNRRFGMYSGLNRQGGYGLLDLDLVKRDDPSGTWLKLSGRNLGLDSRQLRFDHERQGDWSYFFEGSQLSSREPNIVNTGLQGIGTTRQLITSTAAKRDVDLKIDHDIVGLGLRKFMVGGWNVRVSFRQDEKKGSRLFSHYDVYESAVGRPGVLFNAEPIDRTTRQWDVIASYADRKLQLSGGYSGSAFANHAPRLDIAGFLPDGVTSINGLPTAVALPQSNQAHQLHLAGGVNLGESTRVSLKLSRSIARQDEAFALTPDGPAPRASLGGKVVTTLAFADLTLRPADRLDISTMLRYEDRDDRTPTAQYLTAWGPAPAAGAGWSSIPPDPATTIGGNLTPFLHAGYSGFNIPRSLKQLKGSVEAGYRLDDGYRIVAGLEREDMKHSVPEPYRAIAYREKTEETTARLELKRSLSETLNGSVVYSYGRRGGSDYVPDTYDAGADANKINPLIWADRKRSKVRLLADWIPDEQWSLQFIADLSQDKYSGRSLGPRKGRGSFFSGDATYTISDKWTLTGWLSQERSLAEQSSRTSTVEIVIGNDLGPFGADQNTFWEARLRNITTAWGLSLKGKLVANAEVGADLSSSTDIAESGMRRLDGGGTAAVDSLPDYFHRQLSFKLFADYALERNSGIRADFIFDHRRTNDWTWQNWTYGNALTDGTTVSQPSSQNTRFIGVSYYHRWR